jgi:hypothetical protein
VELPEAKPAIFEHFDHKIHAGQVYGSGSDGEEDGRPLAL